MEHEALKLIQQTAIQANNKALLSVDDRDTARVMQPGESIESLEKFFYRRYRFRGRLDTNVLSEFIGYAKKRRAELTPTEEERQDFPNLPTGKWPISGFINTKNLSAKMIFNIGDTRNPGHCDDVAILTLEKLAAYEALLSVNGKKVDQRAAAEWLEEWAPHLQAYNDGNEPIPNAGAIQAIRKIKISEKRETVQAVTTHGASRSALEEIDARSEAGLPSAYDFDCVPFLGFDKRTFRLRVAVVGTNEGAAVILRIVGKEQADEDIALEFKEKLFAELDGVADLTIGTFAP